MTLEMGLLFGVLAGMAILFFTEKLPVELTAFLGLVFLTLFGYVTPSEAFTGFASPAVITMLSIFFVSAALLHTGVADVIAGRVHKWIGNREIPLIIAIMLVAGVLSAFMNNIAAVAVLLPAVASICKKTDIAPSRLFIPLAFGAILGGTTTVVGTPPNILADELLRERGLAGFSLFDFTPMGMILLGTGIVYMITIGRYLLPNKTISHGAGRSEDLARVYQLEDSMFSIRILKGTHLDGMTLGQAQLANTLGVQVIGIERDGKKDLAPGAETLLRGGDVLLVEGSYEHVTKIFQDQGVPDPESLDEAFSHVRCIQARVAADSSFIGKTLRDLHFRERFGAVVVGVSREGTLIDVDLAGVELREQDELLAVGTPDQIDSISFPGDLEIKHLKPSDLSDLKSHLFLLRVHTGSSLAGVSIRETRIGELIGLTVVGIIRGEKALMAVRPKEKIRSEDRLLVTGDTERIRRLVSLGDVQLQQDVSQSGIQSDDVGIVEVTLSPRSRVAGKTLAQFGFREKTGLQVLAIWTKGKAIHTGLVSHKIREGDALLVQGSWQQIRTLGSNPDFVVLTQAAQEQRRTRKAPVALGALAVMIGMVVTGYMPIHVAAFTAATLVALFGAVTMEEVYRSVEWKAIFLVAAILPVGIAIERTGAAALLSDGVTSLTGPFGPYGIMAGMVTLGSALSQALDGAPAVVLMTPVVIPAAQQMGMSTHSVMMAVALATSAAFMTPFSHKANLLVMGAGGYKVTDYLKVGTPLTIILLILMIFLVPVFFPF
jgi:di/tricarboxylate transporter